MKISSILRSQKLASATNIYVSLFFLSSLILVSCSVTPVPSYEKGTTKIKVLVAENFLEDITRNITGERADTISLIPIGLDPHSFEPTPQDISLINNSDVFIINGSGFEEWLNPILSNLPADLKKIEASSGLSPRQPSANEIVEEIDPHFWLDPLKTVHYVENIRDGMNSIDPAGKDIYTKNAAEYIDKLKELDSWVIQQVNTIPLDRRIMVTNHESFGYYADRYGLKIIGTILPGVTTGVTPSAQQMAELVTLIKKNKVPAIFLETGTNPELADQLASETGVKVIVDIYTHSITAPDGKAPTYIDMIKSNTVAIVNALK